MGNLLEKLVVTFDFDADAAKKGFLTIEKHADEAGKKTEEAAKAFDTFRRSVANTLSLFTGGRSLKTLANDTATATESFANLARAIELPAQKLSAYRYLEQVTGGSGHGITDMIANLQAQTATPQGRTHLAQLSSQFNNEVQFLDPKTGKLRTDILEQIHKSGWFNRQDVQYQRQVLRNIGANDDVFNALRDQQFDKDLDQGAGYAPTAEQEKDSAEFRRAVVHFTQSFDNSWSQIGYDLQRPLTPIIENLARLCDAFPRSTAYAGLGLGVSASAFKVFSLTKAFKNGAKSFFEAKAAEGGTFTKALSAGFKTAKSSILSDIKLIGSAFGKTFLKLRPLGKNFPKLGSAVARALPKWAPAAGRALLKFGPAIARGLFVSLGIILAALSSPVGLACAALLASAGVVAGIATVMHKRTVEHVRQVQSKENKEGKTSSSSSDADPQIQTDPHARQVQSKVRESLKKQGFNDISIAAILARIQRESRFNESAIGDHGNAYGLVQWHEDRQKLFRKLHGHRMQEGTMEEQIAFIAEELNGSESRAGAHLRQAKNAQEAGSIISKEYARPLHEALEARATSRLAGQFARQQSTNLDVGGVHIYNPSGDPHEAGHKAAQALKTDILGTNAGIR